MRLATQKEKFALCGAPDDLKQLSKARSPMQLKLSWKLGYSIKTFTCHKIIVPHIDGVYRELSRLDTGLITSAGMNIWGGCHMVRPIRGFEKAEKPPFSAHSWAIAVDVDPSRNGLYVRAPAANLSRPEFHAIHLIWAKYGFVNLGHVIGRDYMHYEASFELLSNPGKFL